MLGTFLYPGQGLGNQMWSYYALRLLAKHTDLSFSLLGMENFKGSEFISLDIGERLLAPSKKFPSEQLFAPFENYYSEKQLVNSVEYCDVRGFDKNCLMIKPNTLIDGYFQSEELVKLVAHEIDDFFSVKDIPELEYLAAADICLINVRGGEYVRNKRLTLHRKYWDNAMHYMRAERNIVRFLVVTDDPIYASRLLPDVTILEQDMHHDFVALTKCKNVIISNSSFSYFPLRFNRQDPCIIAPKYWARHTSLMDTGHVGAIFMKITSIWTDVVLLKLVKFVPGKRMIT